MSHHDVRQYVIEFQEPETPEPDLDPGQRWHVDSVHDSVHKATARMNRVTHDFPATTHRMREVTGDELTRLVSHPHHVVRRDVQEGSHDG